MYECQDLSIFKSDNYTSLVNLKINVIIKILFEL